MSLLDHPEAQALLNDANLTPETVAGCADRLTGFLQRYLPHFYRSEQRDNATLVIRGLLSGLERKTCEPIAIQAGLPRKPVQTFVGAGKWDDEAVMAELRAHVREELAEPDGVMVIDPSAFPKKGTESCGVARQWCGRLGKVDNCQVGVFLAYAAKAGYCAPGPAALPAGGLGRRRGPSREVPRPPGGQVPGEVADRAGPAGPEPARPAPRLDRRRRRVRPGLRVPREAASAAGALRPGRAVQHHGARPGAATAAAQASRRRPEARGAVPAGRRLGEESAGVAVEALTVRGGEKGPLVVDAMTVRVRAKQDGRIGPEERLVVIRPVGESRIDYAVSNAGPEAPLAELVRAQRQRHRIEESSRRATARPVWITTRSAVGSAGTTT